MRLALAMLFALGCGVGPHDAYSTFQGCFNDVRDSGQTAQMTITLCLLDHPIGGHLLNFSTVTECEAYVSSNLDMSKATAVDISAGCQSYIDMKV